MPDSVAQNIIALANECVNMGTGMATDLADDLIEGMKQISRFIGIPERRAFYLAENDELPGVFKQGGRWVGLKSKIAEGYERRAAGLEATV